MRSSIIAAILALAATPALSATIGNPAGMAPAAPQSAPGEPAPHEPNTQDRLFVQLVGAGGMAEVEAARMADSKAQSPAVRSFARAMVRDHGKANDRLMSLAKAARVPPPPKLDPDHQAMLGELKGLSGPQFDLAYMQGQLVDHQKTVQLLQWELAMGQDPELQRFAADTLPDVLEHLRMAQAIIGQLSGAGPQGLALSSTAMPAR
jgi:putative membrane protein